MVRISAIILLTCAIACEGRQGNITAISVSDDVKGWDLNVRADGSGFLARQGPPFVSPASVKFPPRSFDLAKIGRELRPYHTAASNYHFTVFRNGSSHGTAVALTDSAPVYSLFRDAILRADLSDPLTVEARKNLEPILAADEQSK